jgi:hypothetical protein
MMWFSNMCLWIRSSHYSTHLPTGHLHLKADIILQHTLKWSKVVHFWQIKINAWSELQHSFLGAFATFRKQAISFVMSIGLFSARNNSAPTGRILIKFYTWDFFESLSRKFWLCENPTKNDFFTFMTISRWILIGIKNVLDEICREDQNTHFMFDTFFFSKILPFMR